MNVDGACRNHPWYLKKKIERQENMEHINGRYPRYIDGTAGKDIVFYRTPLQAAVESGNVECAQILLAAGADATKRIKSSDDTLAKTLGGDGNHIGLSTLEFAEKQVHLCERDGYDATHYKAICDLLKKQERKES